MASGPSFPAQPELRVLPAFERALTRFKTGLSDQDKKLVTGLTTEAEVRNTIRTLETEQSQRRALRNMQRIQPFVDGMSQYARVIEIFVQMKPEIMAAIWGPLKLMLQLANKFVESFDIFLDACQLLGENLPRFARFAAIFQHTERIQHVISLVYEDVLEFYRRTLKFFRRRAWEMFFAVSWKPFEHRFALLLKNIQEHGRLIDNEVCAEDIERSQKDRELRITEFAEAEKQKRKKYLKTLSDWLQPLDYESARDNVASLQTTGTGDWLLNLKEINEWHSGKLSTVWLSGMPGAGKTVLSSIILKDIESRLQGSETSLLYFFCSHKDMERCTCIAILRTMIYQLVCSSEDLLLYTYSQYEAGPHALSLPKCKKLIHELLAQFQALGTIHTYIVLDGLDECHESERTQLFSVLKQFLNDTSLHRTMRMFLASQELPDIKRVLTHKQVAKILIKDRNKDDIRKFIEAETEQLIEELELDQESAELSERIKTCLFDRAGGMFLWVRLVMRGLFHQTSKAQMETTLEALPVGLDQAYERILDRISSLDAIGQTQAMKVLRWMLCSPRTLTLRELEDAIAIEYEDRTIHDGRRPFRARLQSLCGPIVEVTMDDVEETINFVHFSAKRYLYSAQSRHFVTLSTAQLEVAIVCTTYLNFDCFRNLVSDEDATKFLLNGDIRLYDYVMAFWTSHVVSACALSSSRQELQQLSDSLRRLSVHYPAETEQQEQSADPLQASERKLANLHPDAQRVIKQELGYRRMRGMLGTTNANVDEDGTHHISASLPWSRQILTLQRVLTEIFEGQRSPSDDSLDVIRQKLQKLYGRRLFKCRIPNCKSTGFESQQRRQEHENRHILPFKCDMDICTIGKIGFATQKALEEHYEKYHQQRIPQSSEGESRPRLYNEGVDAEIPRSRRGIKDLEKLIPKTPADAIQSGHGNITQSVSNTDVDSTPSARMNSGHHRSILFNSNKSTPHLVIDLVKTLSAPKLHQVSKISRIRFSPDGRYIATCANTGVYLYQVENDNPYLCIPNDLCLCLDMSFDSQSNFIVTGWEDGSVRVFRIPLFYTPDFLKLTYVRQRHSLAVSTVDCLSIDDEFVSGGRDSVVHVWKLATTSSMEWIGELHVHSGITTVKLVPNGRDLIVVSTIGISLWDLASHQWKQDITLRELDLGRVEFSLDCSEIYAAVADNVIGCGIKKWSSVRWSDKPAVHELLVAHKDTGDISSIKIARDSEWIVSGSKDHSICFWDSAAGTKQLKVEVGDEVVSVAASPVSDLIATGDPSGNVRFWRRDRYKFFSSLLDVDRTKLPSIYLTDGPDWFAIFNPSIPRQLDINLVHTLEHKNLVSCVNFSFDRSYVATGSENVVTVFEVDTGQVITSLTVPPTMGDTDANICRALRFSTDGKFLATCWRDKTIKIWNLQTQGDLKVLQGHKHFISCIDVASNNQLVVSCSRDKTVRIWDIRGKGVEILQYNHTNIIESVAFSPDCTMIAYVSFDNQVFVRTFDQPETVCLTVRGTGIKGHNGRIYSIVFSPCGKHIFTAGRDKTIIMWKLPSNNEVHQVLAYVRRFEGHKGFVSSVAITPDSKWLVSGSGDRSVYFWDVETGGAQVALVGHAKEVRSVSVSRCGELIATASGDKTVRIWRLVYNFPFMFLHHGPCPARR